MREKILIVEDEFIVANDLRIILGKAGYQVCGIASSVEQARKLIDQTFLVALMMRIERNRCDDHKNALLLVVAALGCPNFGASGERM